MNDIQKSQVVAQATVDLIIDGVAIERMYQSLRRSILDEEGQQGAMYFLAGIRGDGAEFLRIAHEAFLRFGGDQSVGGLTVRAALRQLIDADEAVKRVLR